MSLELMGLKVHLSLEDNKLFFQTFLVQAEEMFFLKMILKCIVVDVILMLAIANPPITNMAPFVFIAAMSI